jgi:hypothetical protein
MRLTSHNDAALRTKEFVAARLPGLLMAVNVARNDGV